MFVHSFEERVMRLCRFRYRQQTSVGFYNEHQIVPLMEAASAFRKATGEPMELAAGEDLIDFLPPDGKNFASAKKLASWLERDGQAAKTNTVASSDAELL